ncbi:hypothetical protein OB955_22885 [Halobacteria archaeon AArc-m2/3/4]|uniref:Uncharacterized protein n=1 Tax=Natronoglomus mannanivorans TaxID=2979990 RepID=A0AAP2Z2T9_9EURY|nr:hypothetical protein [Halobacteria archaeon AArc-xg1-1]MCU4975537.1 hypothetical protein [Halobacteria archaeon AArc-m2/3/4]
MPNWRDRYLDDEAEARLASLADSVPDVSLEDATDEYVRACEQFEELLEDGSPTGVIRRAALQRTESRLSSASESESEPKSES